MAAAPEPPLLFPKGYERSSRCKLDLFVAEYLKQWWSEPRNASIAEPVDWTPDSVRWLTQHTLDELLQWLHFKDDQVNLAQRLENTIITNPPQDCGPISEMHFCADLYHVRNFEEWQMKNNYVQCMTSGNITVEAIPLEHCPGADRGDYEDPHLTACQWESSTEPKCVGAVAAVQFASGKVIMHFAHNQGSCERKPVYRDYFQHAEQRLLRELEVLLRSTVQTVADVCIYMLYQPCHMSTDKKLREEPTDKELPEDPTDDEELPNDPTDKKLFEDEEFSCCEFIIEYLKSFETPLPLRIKTAFLHKIYWDPEKRGISEKDSWQIYNAREGMTMLQQHGVLVCAMDKDDWENLWRFAVNHAES